MVYSLPSLLDANVSLTSECSGPLNISVREQQAEPARISRIYTFLPLPTYHFNHQCVRVCEDVRAHSYGGAHEPDTMQLSNMNVLGGTAVNCKDAVSDMHQWVGIPSITLLDKVRVYQIINRNHCVRGLLRDLQPSEAGVRVTINGTLCWD